MQPPHFLGDLSGLWRLDQRPPIRGLTWDWWWWLVMLEDEQGRPTGKQLMTLWSTKDAPRVEVNGQTWRPQGRPGVDEHGGMSLDGMVCAWWFDGQVMHDAVLAKRCSMVVLPGGHPSWPGEATPGRGAGAVVPLLDEDYSMGMDGDGSGFWLTLNPMPEGAPFSSLDLRMEPASERLSTAREATATYAAGLGYDILRLHGTKAVGAIDGAEVRGTAYFQKVKVQAPSVPWYWGVLHLSDGSYIDWFLPHVSPTLSSLDDRAWKSRDLGHVALSEGGLLHDETRGHTERFARVVVGKENEGDLPVFSIRMWNGRVSIDLEVAALARAHWTFDQPTRAGLRSHLTYNEYPLEVRRLRLEDEQGVRTEADFEWIRGNAEHAWGLLH